MNVIMMAYTRTSESARRRLALFIFVLVIKNVFRTVAAVSS